MGWIYLQCRRCKFDPCVWKIPWRREWQPTPVFLPEKSHGQRTLVGYSPRSCKELDIVTEQSTWISRSGPPSLVCVYSLSFSSAPSLLPFLYYLLINLHRSGAMPQFWITKLNKSLPLSLSSTCSRAGTVTPLWLQFRVITALRGDERPWHSGLGRTCPAHRASPLVLSFNE